MFCPGPFFFGYHTRVFVAWHNILLFRFCGLFYILFLLFMPLSCGAAIKVLACLRCVNRHVFLISWESGSRRGVTGAQGRLALWVLREAGEIRVAGIWFGFLLTM